MKAIVKHYAKQENGIDTLYNNGAPVVIETAIYLPLKFGYDSFNVPKVIHGTNIQVADILEVKPLEQRIMTPKVDPLFIIDGHHYSEFQLRQIMLMVAKGEIKETLTVTDNWGNRATILPTGYLSENLPAMLEMDNLAIELHMLNNNH